MTARAALQEWAKTGPVMSHEQFEALVRVAESIALVKAVQAEDSDRWKRTAEKANLAFYGPDLSGTERAVKALQTDIAALGEDLCRCTQDLQAQIRELREKVAI